MDNRKTAKLISLIVVLVGILVMIGWIADIEFLKSIVPGLATLKFVTALSFFFSGLILFFALDLQRGSDMSRMLLPVACMTVLLLMGILLVSSILGLRTGIEELFIKKGLGAVKTTVPGRPSIGTMIDFILIAAAGMISMLNPKFSRMVMGLGGTISAIGAIAVIGYAMGIPALYYSFENVSTAMAIHTSILFVLLGIGFVISSKETAGPQETKA